MNQKGRAVIIGYTHYFYREPKLDKTTWNLFAGDVEKILKNADCLIASCDGKQQFKVNMLCLDFNGVGEDAHENLYIRRVAQKNEWANEDGDGKIFECCKTAQKPYDKYVTACLIAFKYRFGDSVKISSDGSALDWEAGRKIFCNAVTHTYTNIDVVKFNTLKGWLGDTESDEAMIDSSGSSFVTYQATVKDDGSVLIEAINFPKEP